MARIPSISSDPDQARPGFRQFPLLYASISALVLLLVLIAGIAGCGLPIRPTATPGTRAPGGITATPAPPTPTQTTSEVRSIPTRSASPTAEPGGRVLVLTPGAGNAGWWASDDSRTNHLGDSFLYAGYYEGQVFISAARFDLRQIPRGAPIRSASLQLSGLRDDRLAPVAGATWSVQLVGADQIGEFSRADFRTLFNAPASATFFPMLESGDLGVTSVNELSLDTSARNWLVQQIVTGTTDLVLRITGPAGGTESLFAWDAGSGPASSGAAPQLVLSLGPAPATPPPLPTQPFIVATLTPTPANVMTAAAYAVGATAQAQSGAPIAFKVITPTPPPPVITHTPVPDNEATAVAQAAYATAVAATTGTFTPVPTDAVTPIIVMPTPMPENVLTAAVQIVVAASQLQSLGTPTPLSYNMVVATVTPAPVVMSSTPRPLNAATAQADIAYATAVAIATGTFTPMPPHITPTPLPPTPLVVYLDQLALPEVAPTPTRGSQVPQELRGKILFYSDREGSDRLFALDPATGRLAYVTQDWPYILARNAEIYSPDGAFALVVQERVDTEQRQPGVHVRDSQGNVHVLYHTPGLSYDPVWSPMGDRVAFVATEAGNDEIYTIGPDGSNVLRLTTNSWEWDKHPSWSPDGSQIVFVSNRETGRQQLWIMGADGSNPRRLLVSDFNDRDPVWVR